MSYYLKDEGLCPFCHQDVRPRVIEENYLRRDKCQCPECGGIVYVCRTPGCTNYAKGGDFWDDELCPSCTSSLFNTAASASIGLLPMIFGGFFKKK